MIEFLLYEVPYWVYLYLGIGFTWASINILDTDILIKEVWENQDEDFQEQYSLKFFTFLVNMWVAVLFIYDCIMWPISFISLFFHKK